ncbi:MAG: hypothetical protein KAG12_02130, partial [Desulfuromusa sp.]|nr:hypothetical protein [Desulfuromusa sp.]
MKNLKFPSRNRMVMVLLALLSFCVLMACSQQQDNNTAVTAEPVKAAAVETSSSNLEEIIK